MKAESFSEKNQGKYVEIIERNAKQLLHLVDEILDISGGNEKFYRLNPVPIRLSKIVGDIVANLNALALQKGVTIEVRCKYGEVVTLCDPDRIRQVAYNLIGNAIKFTKSGTVVISCDHVVSGERDVFHTLSVEDTGIGISEKNQKKIFSPFSQADDSTSRQFGGTGLGLAISRKIARLMGGDVVLKKSVEGVGSEFVFTFKGEMPADKAVPDSLKEMSQIEDAPMEEQRLAQKKIIVIDDNNDNLVLIERILSREGALVRTATDAASGISMSTDEVPDLMLLDIQMPDMDGYAAARHLRARGYQGPLIAVTAKAMRDEQRLCIEAGFNAVILKPFDSEQLVGKLVESTDSHYG